MVRKIFFIPNFEQYLNKFSYLLKQIRAEIIKAKRADMIIKQKLAWLSTTNVKNKYSLNRFTEAYII